MDHTGAPDTKRPRLTNSPWSAGGSHHGRVLLNPNPSPTTGRSPHLPPTSSPYHQPSPHHYARPPGPGDPHTHNHHQAHQHPQAHPQPPPPPPPHPHAHQHPHIQAPPPPVAQPPIEDRRHHESERYPPMHEHRHPPHSPVHPAFPNYPPKGEPIVKAYPGHDSTMLPQLRRGLSTSNGPKTMTPGTPSALPPQSYGDEKRHLSFDGGPQQQQQQQPQQQPLQQQQQQPPMYGRQPSYPPQTPLSHPQPYDFPPPSYGSQHDGLSYSIQVASSNAKGKKPRASKACETCRQLKARCDELDPCNNCLEKKVECKYRETAPKKQDKMLMDILTTLTIMKKESQDWMATNNRRLGILEDAVRRIAPSTNLQQFEPTREEEDRPASAESAVAPLAEEAYTSSPTEGVPTPAIDTSTAREITRQMEDEKEVEPGPFVQPGVPTIPPNHTTLAAFLLKWRPIEALVRQYLDKENIKYVDEFPIRQEERRGLLRVWGRGEGMDSSRHKDVPHEMGMMEVLDDYSDAGAPSPADCWGGINGSPGPMEGKAGNGLIHTPDFSEGAVWKYVKSFNDNIQNMHPLIIPKELNAMVRLFLDGLQIRRRGKGAASNIAQFVEPSLKRKRSSPAPDGGSSESPLPPKIGKPMFQRSINNALVLLVLALGKICLHKDKLPDVVPVSEPAPHGSPYLRNGVPAPASPSQGSPPSYASHSHSAGLPSPKDSSERAGTGRRSSFQGSRASTKPVASLKRNLDVIPGLDYFAYATDILGGQLAGTSLRHIHAYILAGLFHGQLGRVVESYAYIREAGWALQIKMRPSLDRFKRLQENQTTNQDTVTGKSDNQLVFAFWTCLQLESDIIAELPLPQSHILALQEIMPYPNINLATEYGFDERVLRSYLAQLYLRKNLNQIHQTLYNPDNPQPFESPKSRGGIIDMIENSLDMQFMPLEFKFEESDPPANEILAARLRAKYWGARVITFRPFIKQILEHNFYKAMSTVSPMQSISPAGKILDEFSDEVKAYAQKGIKALVESTRAFHGVEDRRFIITNVFGTAHAQWGNLLTLAAAFKDPVLNQYVDEGLLKDLFAKTISFFNIIAHPSSALSIDMRILEGLQHQLWGPNSNDAIEDLKLIAFVDDSHPDVLPWRYSTGGRVMGTVHASEPLWAAFLERNPNVPRTDLITC